MIPSLGHGNATAGGKPPIIRPLHGLRGVAAGTVLLGHLSPIPTSPSLGVALFFLISGFLMGRIYLTKPFSFSAMLDYAAARFGRVYPLFAAAVALAGALSIFPPRVPFGFEPADVLPHLLLFGSGFTVWTVSVEFQFYAIFLAVWYISGKFNNRSWTLALLLGALIGSIAAASIHSDSSSVIDIRRYLHLFLGGVFLAYCFGPAANSRLVRAFSVALPILALYYLAAFLTIPLMYPQGLVYSDLATCAICAALVLGVTVAPESRVGKLLGTPLFVWLGEVSFGIYLLHRIVQWVIARVDFLEETGVLRIAFTIAATLIAAHLANVFVEKPARDIVRRWGNKANSNWRGGRAAERGFS